MTCRGKSRNTLIYSERWRWCFNSLGLGGGRQVGRGGKGRWETGREEGGKGGKQRRKEGKRREERKEGMAEG